MLRKAVITWWLRVWMGLSHTLPLLLMSPVRSSCLPPNFAIWKMGTTVSLVRVVAVLKWNNVHAARGCFCYNCKQSRELIGFCLPWWSRNRRWTVRILSEVEGGCRAQGETGWRAPALFKGLSGPPLVDLRTVMVCQSGLFGVEGMKGRASCLIGMSVGVRL